MAGRTKAQDGGLGAGEGAHGMVNERQAGVVLHIELDPCPNSRAHNREFHKGTACLWSCHEVQEVLRGPEVIRNISVVLGTIQLVRIRIPGLAEFTHKSKIRTFSCPEVSRGKMSGVNAFFTMKNDDVRNFSII